MTKRAPGSKFGIPSPPLLLAVSQVLLHRVMTSPLGHGVWDALVILTRGSTLRITTWKNMCQTTRRFLLLYDCTVQSPQ